MAYTRIKTDTPTCKGCCFWDNDDECCNGQSIISCYENGIDYIIKDTED